MENGNSRGVSPIYRIDESVSKDVSDAYDGIMKKINFSLSVMTNKIVIVTGCKDECGASTIAANLAIGQAKAGKRALLIDANLRNPVLHKIFNLDVGKGMSELICGEATKLSEVIRKTDGGGLHVITSGALPPNPRDLFMSKAVDSLFREVSELYDIIFVDTAALLDKFGDTLALIRENTEIVLVSKRDETKIDDLNKAEELIDKSDGHFSGVILKDGPRRKKHIFKFF